MTFKLEGPPLRTRGGNAWDANKFMSKLFKPAARAAGFPELTFHDLRHTGASLMIAAGCHVKVIAEQMGHADGGALVLSATDTSTRGLAGRRQSRGNRTFSADLIILLWHQCGMEEQLSWDVE